MVKIRPFRAIRYNLKLKDGLSRLICPPYDVISKEQKVELQGMSVYNFVNIELPQSYEDAKNRFNKWLKKGILKHENKPAIYVYQQEFTVDNVKFARTGFFSLLELEESDRGIIKHEKVSDKPVEDRLNLIKSIQANASPIFCLLNDGKKRIAVRLGKITKSKPLVSFKDKGGIKHSLWIAGGKVDIASIVKALSSEDAFIADGHHRYTMAASYRMEMKKNDKDYNRGKPYNFVMVYFVSMKDKGLVVLPTHRIVRKKPGLDTELKKRFKLEQWDGKSVPNIVMYCDGSFRQLIPKNKSMKNEVPIIGLHVNLLDKLYGKEEISHSKDIKEAIQKAASIDGAAFLINKPDIKKIYELSKKGIIMPHKTTYFYPKVPAGIVIYSLK